MLLPWGYCLCLHPTRRNASVVTDCWPIKCSYKKSLANPDPNFVHLIFNLLDLSPLLAVTIMGRMHRTVGNSTTHVHIRNQFSLAGNKHKHSGNTNLFLLNGYDVTAYTPFYFPSSHLELYPPKMLFSINNDWFCSLVRGEKTVSVSLLVKWCIFLKMSKGFLKLFHSVCGFKSANLFSHENMVCVCE